MLPGIPGRALSDGDHEAEYHCVEQCLSPQARCHCIEFQGKSPASDAVALYAALWARDVLGIPQAAVSPALTSGRLCGSGVRRYQVLTTSIRGVRAEFGAANLQASYHSLRRLLAEAAKKLQAVWMTCNYFTGTLLSRNLSVLFRSAGREDYDVPDRKG